MRKKTRFGEDAARISVPTECEEFFDKHKVPKDILDELLVKCKAQVTVVADYYVEISCHEDTWRIALNSIEGEVNIKHNNYFQSFFGERYITKGFHHQNIPDRTLEGALKYIMAYDYRKFHNPNEIMLRNIRRIFINEFEKELWCMKDA